MGCQVAVLGVVYCVGWMGRISSGLTIALGDLIDHIRAWEDLLSTCAMAAFVLGNEGQSRLVGGWVVGRPCPEGYSAPWNFSLGTSVLGMRSR